MSQRSRIVVGIVALALLARLIVVFATPHWVPETDSADYDRIAVSLVRTGGFGTPELAVTDVTSGPTAFRAPLYPLALAAVYEVVGTGNAHRRWQAGRVQEAVFGAVAVWLLMLIAQQLWPSRRRLAVIAGLLAAVDPPLILAGSSLMTESLFIPLVLGSVLCALRCSAAEAVRARWGWAVAAGLIGGLATLTRTTGLVLILPLFLMVFWPLRGRGLGGVRLAGVLAAAFLLALVPWTVRNDAVFHRFVPLSTESGYALAGIYNNSTQHIEPYPALWRPAVSDFILIHATHPGYNEAEYSDALNRIATTYITHHPFSILRTSFWNLVRMLNLSGFHLERIAAVGDAYPIWLALLSVPAFWLVALAALRGVFLRDARAPGIWFWGCAILMFAVCLPVIGTTRYRVPVDPWLVLLAALALDSWLSGARARWPRRTAAHM